MKKILVGFDGSEGSERALNRAINLIDESGELILLAVIQDSEKLSVVDVNAYKTLRKRAENLLNDTIEDLGKQSFEIKSLIEEGDAAAKIIDIANKLGVDLIVLGSKGESEIAQYTIGSVATVSYTHLTLPTN